MIYMIIAGYFEDDASDELTNDPVFKPVLNKDALASQPTVSRFFNRMDEDTLNQFEKEFTVFRCHRLSFWIWIPLFLMHTVNRKAEPLTFIIKAMDTIRLLCNPAEGEWYSPWKNIPSCG